MTSDLIDDYPENLVVVKMHVNGDGYDTAWGQARLDGFFGLLGAAPTMAYDGTLICPDEDYRLWLQQRLDVPTDVTIQLSASEVQGATWDVHASVCVESGGSGRPMRVYTAALLDDYPDPPSYSRNHLMQDVIEQDISVAAGSCVDVVTRVTFDAISWSQPQNIKVALWAQHPGTTYPADVYQAAQMSWPFPQAPQLTSIVVSPATASTTVGGEVSFSATGKDQYGNDFVLTNPSWSLSGEGEGTFDPQSGSSTTVFTATYPGGAEVSCSEGGIAGTAALTIAGDPPQLAGITITPANVEMDVGQQVIFTAVGSDQYGNDYELTTASWSTSGEGGGDFVPPSGTATPIFVASRPGSCQVICAQDGVTGTAEVEISGDPAELTTIEITPASTEMSMGEEIIFLATGKDQYGNDHELSSPMWSVSGEGDGIFDPASGSNAPIFTATHPGSAQVSCQEGGVSGTATVVITGDPPELTTIAITPSSVEMALNQQVSFTAVGTDQYGNPFELGDAMWSTVGEGDGSFDPSTGSETTVFTATAAGSCQVVCTDGEIDGQAEVEIVSQALPAPRRVQGRQKP